LQYFSDLLEEFEIVLHNGKSVLTELKPKRVSGTSTWNTSGIIWKEVFQKAGGICYEMQESTFMRGGVTKVKFILKVFMSLQLHDAAFAL